MMMMTMMMMPLNLGYLSEKEIGSLCSSVIRKFQTRMKSTIESRRAITSLGVQLKAAWATSWKIRTMRCLGGSDHDLDVLDESPPSQASSCGISLTSLTHPTH
eukprot:GHVN01043009.1.p2 GENE.GHVN01043009.1~~GHVN01043009.1.p2  ORF type:complete len:103 (+),score=20.49 GHVN01043009.1:141-449(+)